MSASVWRSDEVDLRCIWSTFDLRDEILNTLLYRTIGFRVGRVNVWRIDRRRLFLCCARRGVANLRVALIDEVCIDKHFASYFVCAISMTHIASEWAAHVDCTAVVGKICHDVKIFTEGHRFPKPIRWVEKGHFSTLLRLEFQCSNIATAITDPVIPMDWVPDRAVVPLIKSFKLFIHFTFFFKFRLF